MKNSPIFILLVILLPLSLFAHGVEYNVNLQNSVVIRVFYDDGYPMDYADYEIKSSDGEIFQIGVTDRQGILSFIPDIIGKWEVKIDDGMGHGILKDIEINEEMLPVINKDLKHSRLQKLVMGICVIFGITGILFYIVARREKNAHT